MCVANLQTFTVRWQTVKITWCLNPDIVKTIYLAVIEPIILYAARVWHEAAAKQKSIKKTECSAERLRTKNL